MVPMIEKTIAAAKARGARILLPATIYNYGSDALPVLREDSPQHATTHKGTIRIELEKRMQDAVASGVRSLIVRFGDFFGPRSGQSRFAQGIIKPNQPVTSIAYPEAKCTGHDWAYLTESAETFALLTDREEEHEPFARYHFRGHWDADGTEMIAAIRKAVGNASILVRGMSWCILKLASLFDETMRELVATRPLWQTPIQLDNMDSWAKNRIPPLVTAVETTLRGLGCLNEGSAIAAS